MKKQLFLLPLLSISFISLVHAQGITVAGSVRNEAGNALPLAMVEAKSNSAALKVDSAGSFAITIDPKTKLLVTCPGYEDKQVSVKSNKNIIVVLEAKAGTNIDENPFGTGSTNQFGNSMTQRQGAANSIIYGNTGGSTGALLPVLTHTEATRGSRYLYDEWVDGTVLTTKDSVVKNPNYHFNYDKVSGSLLLSQDKRNAIEINADQIKAFSLTKDGVYYKTFEDVPDLDKKHYVELLSAGNKYKIYKKLTTTFVKNNYRTDGMTSSGNNYDEYVDEGDYYVLDVKTHQFHKLALKKKAIKEAFPGDADKVDSYFEAYPTDINEHFLANLGNYLNH